MHSPETHQLTRPRVIALALLLAMCPGFSAQAQRTHALPRKAPVTRHWEAADVYLTAKSTNDRLTKKDSLRFEALEQPEEHRPTIILDKDKTFQTIVGIGGALTDASAETFYKLPVPKQQEILTALFDKEKGNLREQLIQERKNDFLSTYRAMLHKKYEKDIWINTDAVNVKA